MWIPNNKKKVCIVKQNVNDKKYRDREYEILFMDLRQMGSPYEKKYIEFVNKDDNVDYDAKMKELQKELPALLKEEEESKKDLLKVFKELGYEIK